MNIKEKKSIKSRVIFQVSSLIALAMFFITVIVSLLVYRHMSDQMFSLLENSAYATQQRMEQRIRYLVEDSVLLTKNEFIINSLLDQEGRDTYLPPLVKNFMEGKDVISLSIVDFDGKAIFQTQEKIPQYKDSPELRASLALGQVTIYLNKDDNKLILIAPIHYYSTTQGSIVVVFDTNAIVKRNMPNDHQVYMRLIKDSKTIFEYMPQTNTEYKTHLHKPLQKTPYLSQLDIMMEFGIAKSTYTAPVWDTVKLLIAIGLLFVLIGVLISIFLAGSITKPILELYRRVKTSDGGKAVQCSPIGTDDELEELAQAFDERSMQLQYQAHHDGLTGLPNRALFIERLQHSIRVSKRENTICAVLFLDLDRFKEINDSFGHTVGDELLQNVAQMLKETVRASDTVARLGGDEFIILIESIYDKKVIINTILTIMDQFKKARTLTRHQFFISCSIGVAIYPTHAHNSDEILQNADAAMYKAKSEGRNNYQFYTEDMTKKAYGKILLGTQIHQAILNNEFEVYYQPQTDMRTNRLIGTEALIRWKHPEVGMISPDKFIPIAEENGLIIEIDGWVMRTAMKQYVEWQKMGLDPGILSLNVSLLQLNNKNFVNKLLEMMKDTGLKKEFIELEITETQAMKNPERTIEMLNNIKKLGIILAVDDFGTGQSSLSYLKKLPVDKIKIDQSFVHDLPDDRDDVELTQAIIAISKSLNLGLIAEGVETKEHVDFLLKHGCFEAQGFYYSRPLCADDMQKILVERKG